MTQQVRVLHPVTFFDGKNDHPHAVSDFTPQERDPKAEALFEMPEPTAADLAAVEPIAEAGLTEDPEAGITVPDGHVEGQLTLPLDIGAEPSDGDEGGKKDAGKVPPA